MIEPHYPRGDRGRPPIGIKRMLRIYFLQQWFNLSDPQVEDAIYDIAPMRQFAGIDLGCEAAPDLTTICKFRHGIEAHGLGKDMLAAVNAHLAAKGVKIGIGAIVDATIIAAPPSTKNADGIRDPHVHQLKKGIHWHFGMKAHVGVDSKEKIIHTVVATAANVHDARVIGQLLHGRETKVWGDSAYQGQKQDMKAAAPQAQDMTRRHGSRGHPLTDIEAAKNRYKSKVRAKGEHPLPEYQAHLRLCHHALSRAYQERQPPIHRLRTGQPAPQVSRPDPKINRLTPALRSSPGDGHTEAEKSFKTRAIIAPNAKPDVKHKGANQNIN